MIWVVLVPLMFRVCAGFANDMPPLWVTKTDILDWEMGVDPAGAWLGITLVMAFCFCFTVLVEYLVGLCLLGWSKVSKPRLFGWVLIVNVITNPAAQLILIRLGNPQLWGHQKAFWVVAVLIELAVVAVEFLLLRRIFDRMYHHGNLSHRVTPRRVFIIALAANGASFVLGLVGDHVFLMPEYIVQFLQKWIGYV